MPPTPPLPTNQSASLQKPAAATANGIRIRPNTPAFLASRPRGVPGVCTPRWGGREETAKPLPLKPAVTALRKTTHQPRAVAGPAAARSLVDTDCRCRVGQPLLRHAPPSLISRLPGGRAADVTRRPRRPRPLGPLTGQLSMMIDR